MTITITAQEMEVDNASYPTPKITQNSYDYRPLGLGYANLGALLLARGIAYDSDEGRAYAAAVTALMCGQAYLASAEDSPDAVRDGAVAGCRFGIIDGEDVRTTAIVDRAGRAVALKLEGLAARADEPGVFDVVVDMDRHDEAARLGVLVVTEER